MPLAGTHLSLGGYADIWMAGFTGLGTVALIRGISQRIKIQTALGVSLLLFSAAIKKGRRVAICSRRHLPVYATAASYNLDHPFCYSPGAAGGLVRRAARGAPDGHAG